MNHVTFPRTTDHFLPMRPCLKIISFPALRPKNQNRKFNLKLNVIPDWGFDFGFQDSEKWFLIFNPIYFQAKNVDFYSIVLFVSEFSSIPSLRMWNLDNLPNQKFSKMSKNYEIWKVSEFVKKAEKISHLKWCQIIIWRKTENCEI